MAWSCWLGLFYQPSLNLTFYSLLQVFDGHLMHRRRVIQLLNAFLVKLTPFELLLRTHEELSTLLLSGTSILS